MNPISYKYFKNIGKKDDEIIPSNIHLSNFTRAISQAKRVFIADFTVESKTSKTSFFVFYADGSYNLLLGRDWIHGNQ